MGCFSSKTIEGENEIAKDVVLYERTATSFNQPRTSVAERVKRNRDLEKSKKKKPKFGPKITVKYDIKAQIGESGKYTKVFRVENKYTKQPFALKLLIKPEGQAAMECEKVILNRIKHKNIVRLSEVIMSDKKRICALVLELITGGNLFERIHEKGMFSERAAVKVLVQMLDGIQYLHGIGITHRGLTLHNVLFYHQGKDSRVVLTDFATAHTRREYFAPEVVLERQYTQSVDVWAVGVITYAMLAAEFPFPSRDKQAMLLAISRAEYSMDSEVWQSRSELCRSFVSSLLALDPKNRLTAAEAFQHQWLSSRLSKDVPSSRGDRSSSVISTTSSVRSLHHLRPSPPVRPVSSSRPVTSLRRATPHSELVTQFFSNPNRNQPAAATFNNSPHNSMTSFGSTPRHMPTTVGGQSRYRVAAAPVLLSGDYGSDGTVTRKSNRRRREQQST